MSASPASPSSPSQGLLHPEAWAPFDEALALLADRGPELRNGFTSHLPMVAEALCALERPEAVLPWVRRHLDTALPWPAAREPFAPGRWREALGRFERVGDWRAFFQRELDAASWRRVLERWAGRLAPGVSAAALHGVIRTGHAVRALEAGETPRRRAELGDALATWAAWYQQLPGRPAAGGSPDPREALAGVVPLPPERRHYAGSIVSSLEALGPDFAPVIGLLDPGDDPAPTAAELGGLFAEVYLANAHDVLSSIVFTHGVTGFGALGHLLPQLRPETARTLLRYGWQAACGLYVAFGSRLRPEREPDVRGLAPDALADRAAAHGDDHAVKLTEVCLGLHRRFGSAAPLAAADHALTTLPPSQPS